MSAHAMSQRSFTLSFQFSTNVYISGKTVPCEEYVVANTIALIRDTVGKKVCLFLPASKMHMPNESLQTVNIRTGQSLSLSIYLSIYIVYN